jgi:oligoendopeptidase F
VARIFEVEVLNNFVDPFGFWWLERWRSQFFRPMYQTIFEAELRAKHLALDIGQMSSRLVEILQMTYGSSVTVTPSNGYEWVKSTHLFRPFSLIEYAVSFLVGMHLHRYLSLGGDLSGILLCKSMEDLSDLLKAPLFEVDTYAPDLADLERAVSRLESQKG